MKRILYLFSIFALSFVSCDEMELPSRIQAGDSLPSFSVTLNNGETVSDVTLSTGKGLLVFFHTQCPDCVKELEILQPFYDKYSDELRIALISRAQNDDDIDEYWQQKNYTMPFSAQQDRKIYELFSNTGIPFVVYTENGIVVKTWDDNDMFNEEEYLKLKK